MEQWAWLIDWLTVGIIALVIWSFVPIGWRRTIWAGLRWLGRGFVELGYAIVGREPPPTAAAEPRSAYRGSRSSRLPSRSARSNAPNATSPRQDAEPDRVQHSHSAFGVRDDPAPMTVADPRLPQNVEELQKLARAITIHAQNPRGAKQRGILEAWGAKPGGGPEWERASALFDLAVPPKGRPAAPVEPAEELQLEPAP